MRNGLIKMAMAVQKNDLVRVTTNPRHEVSYGGPLDFAFFVHPRHANDIRSIYPDLAELSDDDVLGVYNQHSVHIGCTIEVVGLEKTLYGELVGIPLTLRDIRQQVHAVRESLFHAMAYCESRGTKVIGLGALLPSMTRYGRVLAETARNVGITTGHSFTAHAIAEFVRKIESIRGDVQSIAIVGAAGSTGRAATKAILADNIRRRLTLVDLPGRLGQLSGNPGQNGQGVVHSDDIASIRHSSIVVCVSSSTSAILNPEVLAPDCIVLDDAQPENISYEIASERPDVVVVKCLARVPGLRNPFDLGLFDGPPTSSHQEIAFTCLAETVALAASGHNAHFTIGDPTDRTIREIADTASRLGIGIAPFYSFPEVGAVRTSDLRGRNHVITC